MKKLDARLVLSAGGWDPRYAVTLAVASNEDVGAALIDTNGDQADVDLDVYERDAEGNWLEVGSSNVGDEGGWLTGQMAAIFGRDEPGRIVDLDYAGQHHSVIVSETGWWLFVAPAVPGSDAVPVCIGTS